jgi:hypothetical protein
VQSDSPHDTGTTPDTAHDELVQAARGWALDCMWKEDPADIAEMSDTAILRGVNRHYAGGLAQCARDGLLSGEAVAWAADFDAKRAEGRAR